MSLSTLFSGIADAIRAKDGTTEPIVANDFPARIQAIPSGGASPTTPLDPVEVYKATRPSDWLPMPTPADNEMYLLFHIPDGASSLLAFTVTCSFGFGARVNPIYYVALGTVADGQFVEQSRQILSSGDKYEAELFSDDYGNLTSDGMKQVMVKVFSPTILTWEPSTHSKKTSPANFTNWNIVEIACRLPSGTKVRCGRSSEDGALCKLRYFSWFGQSTLTDTTSMFQHCIALLAIPELDTSSVTSMAYMLMRCHNLLAIPALDTSKVTNMSSLFNDCNSMTAIPQLDTSNATNMSFMFHYCYGLLSIPALDTSKVTDISYLFNECLSIMRIPPLDLSSAPDSIGTFRRCNSLGSIQLKPDVSGWTGCDLSLSDCSMGHQALVDLLNSLPTITGAHTLTLTGNPGVSELTDVEKAVATGKNWTLAL